MADDDIFSGIESAELIDSGASAQPLLDTARMLGKRPRERGALSNITEMHSHYSVPLLTSNGIRGGLFCRGTRFTGV